MAYVAITLTNCENLDWNTGYKIYGECAKEVAFGYLLIIGLKTTVVLFIGSYEVNNNINSEQNVDKQVKTICS
jgi:hypothetical protein